MTRKLQKIGIALSLCLSLGCGRDPLQAGAHQGIRAIPGVRADQNSYALRWMELPEAAHPVLDELESSLGSIGRGKNASEELYRVLSQVVPEEPTGMLRLAMHELLVRRGPEGTKRVFQIATDMESRFRGHPDQLYLSGYLRWVVIRARSQINSSALGQRARDDLKASWIQLLSTAPDYRGPQGVTADWLNEQLRALD